jgi:hypothetical protein
MISLPIVASFISLMVLQLGGFDMAVAQKWSTAKIVKYHAEGVHKGREMVVFGDYEGKADVVDRITVDFTWDVKKSKVLGTVTVTDGKTELTNIKSDGTNCPPPQLKGDYEHFQMVSQSVDGAQILIKGVKNFPAASVSNYPGSCSMRAIPGGKEEAMLTLAAVEPEALGMPIMPGSPMVVAADRKSFILKVGGGWEWTLTPTLVE